MHILLIHQAFATLTEPGGTRHHELARLLAARGHRLTIIASPVSYITGIRTASSGAATPPADDGVHILRASVYEAHHRSFVHRVFAFVSFMLSSFWLGLGVRGVDLVWGTSPPIFQAATALLLARLKGAHFLLEVRDLWPEFAVAVGVLRSRVLIGMSEWLERTLYRSADRVLVNSPGFEMHVRQRGARQVELVPNGADPAMFHPEADGHEWRSQYGLGSSFVALYAGAHGMSNDLGLVVEAARLLQAEDIRIVFVGDGKEKLALLQHAAGLPNVLFLPSVSKERIPSVLAGMNAGIAILKAIPAYATTYPNKVFDYMAAGRPVILAIDGVIRRVVETAGCGVFVPPGDAHALAAAIRRLAADREAARAMGLAGRRYIEQNFGRHALAEQLAGIMEAMLAETRSSQDNA